MRECKCGATFETLSGYRMHQRNECPGREKVDLTDKSEDAIVNEMVEGLLKCEKCGKSNDGVDEIERGIVDGTPAITVQYDCSCGWSNRNTAFLE